MKNILYKYRFFIIIIITSFIISIPLLWKNLYVYFDDGIQHIARAYSTYLSMKNGESTNVLSNLTNGFGYSWNLFYGPFSTLLIIFCKLFTTTFINAYKISSFLAILLSRNYYVFFCKQII